jgi:hypothetical protein
MSNLIRKLSKSINNTKRNHIKKKEHLIREGREKLIQLKIESGMSKEDAELAVLIATSPYKVDRLGIQHPIIDFSLLSEETRNSVLSNVTEQLQDSQSGNLEIINNQ